jgi:hypothetical protein
VPPLTLDTANKKGYNNESERRKTMSVQVATHTNEAVYTRNTIINHKEISASEVEHGESDGLPYGLGCMKGKMWMADDWDEPLEDFREYME